MENYLLIASSSDIVTKIISLILFIKRFSEISSKLNKNSILSFTYFENSKDGKKTNWTKTSIFKFMINIILSILSLSLGILCIIKYLKDKKNNSECIFDNCLLNMSIYTFYFIFEALIWLLSSILYYKEIKNYRNQSWNGLRFFWFTNGLFNFVKIATITIIILNLENKKFYRNYIICFHCFLSIILFFYSIFRPYDSTYSYKNIEQIVNDDIINNELNNISNDNSLLDYTDTFTFDDDYNPKDEFLYSITIKNNKPEEIRPKKIKLFLKIKADDFTTLRFVLILRDDKYKKDKFPAEICDFFKKLIKIYKSKKYENNIINLVQQSYNISLTLNPKRNSYTGKQESINTLMQLCNEAIKISNNFLLDLLLFIDFPGNPLVELLQNNNVESVIEDLDSIDEEDENESNDITNISKRKTSNNLSVFENNNLINASNNKFFNNMNQMSRDMIKLYNFFNNILIRENFINLKINQYNEEKSEIECILKMSPNKQTLINVNSENLLDIIYDDNLKTYYIDNFNSMIENNDYSILDLLLSDYLNNLIYYDDSLFKEFHINKILNLDIEKFNDDLLINFFENGNIECQNDISNIIFDVIFEPLNKNILPEKIFYTKFTLKGIDKKNFINDNNKEININLNILKLYKIIDNILPIINSYLKKNLNELYSMLNELKLYIENFIEIIFNLNKDDIKKINFKSIEEVNRIKYKKLLFGEKYSDEFIIIFQKILFEKCENYKDNLDENNIAKINQYIKEINKCINSMLNKNSLKYALFFSDIRKIFGISKFFNLD